jgi:hypothetical protein
MGRAGRRTVLAIRRERVVLAHRLWRRYLVLAVGFAAAAILTAFWLPPFGRGFVAGIYLSMWVALVAYSLLLNGSHLRMMGAEAEMWTSQQFRKVKGLWVLDAVEFADRDIGHVAFMGDQVLAVETKKDEPYRAVLPIAV